MTDNESNIVAKFIDQMLDVAATNDVMDGYNRQSFDIDKVIEYRALEKMFVEGALCLLEFVLTNQDELRRRLQAILHDH